MAGVGRIWAPAAVDGLKMDAVVAVVEVDGFGDVSLLGARGEEDGGEVAVELAAAPAGFTGPDGDEKNEVMEALAFGFFVVLVATSAALRFNGVAITLLARQRSSCFLSRVCPLE